MQGDFHILLLAAAANADGTRHTAVDTQRHAAGHHGYAPVAAVHSGQIAAVGYPGSKFACGSACNGRSIGLAGYQSGAEHQCVAEAAEQARQPVGVRNSLYSNLARWKPWSW